MAIPTSRLRKFTIAGSITIDTAGIGERDQNVREIGTCKTSIGCPFFTLEGKGPLKGKIAPAAKRIGGKMRLKAKVAKAAPEKRSARPPAAEERFPDQTGLRTTPSPGEGYVRLRIHVDEEGEASVVASHFVRSTLVQPSMLQGNYAYEVTEGENRLHLDSIQTWVCFVLS